jgi:hypothetical protein
VAVDANCILLDSIQIIVIGSSLFSFILIAFNLSQSRRAFSLRQYPFLQNEKDTLKIYEYLSCEPICTATLSYVRKLSLFSTKNVENSLLAFLLVIYQMFHRCKRGQNMFFILQRDSLFKTQ